MATIMDWIGTGLALGMITFGMMLYTASAFRRYPGLDSSRFGISVVMWSGVLIGVLIVLLCLSYGPQHLSTASYEEVVSLRSIATTLIMLYFSRLRRLLQQSVCGTLDTPDRPNQERILA